MSQVVSQAVTEEQTAYDALKSLPTPNVAQVLALTGYEKEASSGRSSVRISCPIHDKRSKSMGVDLTKDMFNCFKCNAGGGSLRLYAKLAKNIPSSELDDNPELYYALKAELLGLSEEDLSLDAQSVIQKARTFEKIEIRDPVKQATKASPSTISKVYEELIRFKPMDDYTKKDLLRRGYTNEDFKKYMYGTTLKEEEVDGFIKSLSDKTDEHGKPLTVEGVPGFYQDKQTKDWKLNTSLDGYYVGYKYFNVLTTGLQIAVNKEKVSGDIGKYIWLSSANNHYGVRSGASTHYVGSIEPTLFITEGATKANLFHKFTGLSAIAISGINVHEELLKQLDYLISSNKLKHVVLMFDMDKLVNEHVADGIQNLKSKLSNKFPQLSVGEIDWDEKHKGIDDYLYFLNENNQLYTFIQSVLSVEVQKGTLLNDKDSPIEKTNFDSFIN